MVAKILYALAVVLFVVAVANSDVQLVWWGLAAFAGGHVVEGVTP